MDMVVIALRDSYKLTKTGWGNPPPVFENEDAIIIKLKQIGNLFTKWVTTTIVII